MTTLTKEPTTLGMPWEEQYGYAQAVKVGDTVYLSGQVSHDDQANILGVGDMEVQMRTAYANVGKVLARYGATIDNLTPLGNDAAQYFFIAPGMKVVYCSDQAAWDLVPYGYSSCTQNSYWMDMDPQRYATRYWPAAPEVNGVSYVEVRPQLIAYNTQYYGGAARRSMPVSTAARI